MGTMTHDCGCVTHWSDELNHPVYDKACFGHKPFAGNWLVRSRPREPVKSSA